MKLSKITGTKNPMTNLIIFSVAFFLLVTLTMLSVNLYLIIKS